MLEERQFYQHHLIPPPLPSSSFSPIQIYTPPGKPPFDTFTRSVMCVSFYCIYPLGFSSCTSSVGVFSFLFTCLFRSFVWVQIGFQQGRLPSPGGKSSWVAVRKGLFRYFCWCKICCSVTITFTFSPSLSLSLLLFCVSSLLSLLLIPNFRSKFIFFSSYGFIGIASRSFFLLSPTPYCYVSLHASKLAGAFAAWV
jgi:hypothetical protein